MDDFLIMPQIVAGIETLTPQIKTRFGLDENDTVITILDILRCAKLFVGVDG
jgi:hypothetical protein